MNWFQVAQEELECFFDLEERIDEEEKKQRAIRAIDAFHDLFVQLVGKLQIRDEWPEPHCHIAPFATGIIERSAKMQAQFTLGVSLHGWFIEAPLIFADQIRHMRDDYWQHIVNLASLGKAELYDYGRPLNWESTPEAKKLVKHKISLVFSIARDYTLLSLNPDPSDHGFLSVGGINIALPVESDEGAVTEFFERALSGLYRSNYLLYRSAYLERKRRFKKLGLREPPLMRA
jgi:hypothetical protein